MKVEDFDTAQPGDFKEVRPGDMVAMTAAEDAREVQKIMIERSVGNPPRVWVTWAGYADAQIYPASTVIWICMD